MKAGFLIDPMSFVLLADGRALAEGANPVGCWTVGCNCTGLPASEGIYNRIARVFWVQHTKTGKIDRKPINNTKWPQNIPNCSKLDQIGIKYINIFH
jgi:hypothetical protein